MLDPAQALFWSQHDRITYIDSVLEWDREGWDGDAYQAPEPTANDPHWLGDLEDQIDPLGGALDSTTISVVRLDARDAPDGAGAGAGAASAVFWAPTMPLLQFVATHGCDLDIAVATHPKGVDEFPPLQTSLPAHHHPTLAGQGGRGGATVLLVRQNVRGSLRVLCDCPDGFDPRLLSFGGEEAGKLVFPDARHAHSHENPLIERLQLPRRVPRR